MQHNFCTVWKNLLVSLSEAVTFWKEKKEKAWKKRISLLRTWLLPQKQMLISENVSLNCPANANDVCCSNIRWPRRDLSFKAGKQLQEKVHWVDATTASPGLRKELCSSCEQVSPLFNCTAVDHWEALQDTDLEVVWRRIDKK